MDHRRNPKGAFSDLIPLLPVYLTPSIWSPPDTAVPSRFLQAWFESAALRRRPHRGSMTNDRTALRLGFKSDSVMMPNRGKVAKVSGPLPESNAVF
jgi:hypothetical protein